MTCDSSSSLDGRGRRQLMMTPHPQPRSLQPKNKIKIKTINPTTGIRFIYINCGVRHRARRQRFRLALHSLPSRAAIAVGGKVLGCGRSRSICLRRMKLAWQDVTSREEFRACRSVQLCVEIQSRMGTGDTRVVLAAFQSCCRVSSHW